MIELGDLREGIMPIDLEDTVKQIIETFDATIIKESIKPVTQSSGE